MFAMYYQPHWQDRGHSIQDFHRAAAKSLQSCPTLCDPTDSSLQGSRPWDSPGKNTGVGCHFLLQCMKVESESEVSQLCPTLHNPMDCSLPGSSAHGFSRQEDWSGSPVPSPSHRARISKQWPTDQTLPAAYFGKYVVLLKDSHAHSLTYHPSMISLYNCTAEKLCQTTYGLQSLRCLLPDPLRSVPDPALEELGNAHSRVKGQGIFHSP